MRDKVANLYSENNNIAYETLLELEAITAKSNELYDYFDDLLAMLNNEKAFIRVRGFRLICSLAKWDNENKIAKNIDIILKELEDKNGTSVRQCLEKLNLLLKYHPELTSTVKNKLSDLDLSQYKASMKSLIQKDIKRINTRIEK